jgi:hypothetical protein
MWGTAFLKTTPDILKLYPAKVTKCVWILVETLSQSHELWVCSNRLEGGASSASSADI